MVYFRTAEPQLKPKAQLPTSSRQYLKLILGRFRPKEQIFSRIGLGILQARVPKGAHRA